MTFAGLKLAFNNIFSLGDDFCKPAFLITCFFSFLRFLSRLGLDPISRLFFKRLPIGSHDLISDFYPVSLGIHAKNERAALIPLVEMAGQAEVGVSTQMNFFKIFTNQIQAFFDPWC